MSFSVEEKLPGNYFQEVMNAPNSNGEDIFG